MIRELTKENLQEMTDLFVAVFTGEPWNEVWDRSFAEERLEIFLTNRYPVSFGFYDGDDLIGFVLGNCEPYQTTRLFSLEEMCVSAEFQGSGIGTQLFEALETELKNLGVTGMSFRTLKDSPAQQFYEKQGCAISDSVPCLFKQL